ncbi:MAG: desulfoferrodoxin family protein [Patescibacteria group bacterium]|nr:desulfoferrodoxin family protein [Patescibacteria group bacterium]
MTELNQIYKCKKCGNIVEVVHAGGGNMICCDQPMELLAEKIQDEGYEKHVPVVEKTEKGVNPVPQETPYANSPTNAKLPKDVILETVGKNLWYGVKVKIGAVPHPMLEDHYIEWVEILADGKTYRKFLKPGDAPEAEFCVEAENITAREHCNLHGLWKV